MTLAAAKPLSAEAIRRALADFQIAADDHQIALIQRYTGILLHWNEKLNLTAIRDPLDILHRHFCESMYGGVAVEVFGRLADIGSGAGFPGVPLKILRPELELAADALILGHGSLEQGRVLALENRTGVHHGLVEEFLE